jgi:hypothetical protein
MNDTLEELWNRINRLEDELERISTLEQPVMWDDLRVPMSATKLGGSKDPGFAVFKTNGSGSQGTFIFWFDAASEEELYFVAQLPHSYKEGSNITPHVHWVPKADGKAGEKVSWGLEYSWQNMGSTFGNTTIIYTNTHSPAETLVAERHYRSDMAAITGTGKTISSMLVCRLFRNATGAGGSTDDYTADAGLLEFDFHFQMDTRGSKTIGAK